MDKRKLSYVIDTNVLIDYIDIIPSPDGVQAKLEEATADLSEAHLIIPTVVIRELSNFKKEKSERGKAARQALSRIYKLVVDSQHTMDEVYNLQAGISLSMGKQTLSVLPVHKNFTKALPYHPSDTDMDGQIILTALSVAMIEAGLPISGGASSASVLALKSENVILLTNDKGLAIRARERGLKTERYGHKYPDPYTGRRKIAVPKELFLEFYNTQRISREQFEQALPDERKLVANEFIIMELEDKADYPFDFNPRNTRLFEHIGRYNAEEDAIVRLRFAPNFPLRLKNAGQAMYAEALMDPSIAAVICSGPAGCGKTYMSTIYGYEACKNGDFIGVTTVPCESHNSLGALPGDLDEKMDPAVQPLKNALRNYLLENDSGFSRDLALLQKFGADGDDKSRNEKGWSSKAKNGGKNGSERSRHLSRRDERQSRDCDDYADNRSDKRPLKERLSDRVNLIWDNWFSNVPIEHARGRDFAYELAIYDEFQDQNAQQADTLIKRLGQDGKVIITGDVRQIHSAYLDQNSNGLVYAAQVLYDNPMVAQVCFTEDEIIRHPLVEFVAKRQAALAAEKARPSES